MRGNTATIRMGAQNGSADDLLPPTNRLAVQSLTSPASGEEFVPSPLRMYTEEQVAEMLQVSLSQLRKWRVKKNGGKQLGPPFRKIGRLVRYPEAGLLAYINCQ